MDTTMKTTFHYNMRTNDVDVKVNGEYIGSRRTRVEAGILADEYRAGRAAEPTPAPESALTRALKADLAARFPEPAPTPEPTPAPKLAESIPDAVRAVQELYAALKVSNPITARILRDEMSALFETWYSYEINTAGARLWLKKIMDDFTPKPPTPDLPMPTPYASEADYPPAHLDRVTRVFVPNAAPPAYPCPDCAGRGYHLNGHGTGDSGGGYADTCDTCKGSGSVDWAPCQGCNGSGEHQSYSMSGDVVTCWYCNGTGRAEDAERIAAMTQQPDEVEPLPFDGDGPARPAGYDCPACAGDGGDEDGACNLCSGCGVLNYEPCTVCGGTGEHQSYLAAADVLRCWACNGSGRAEDARANFPPLKDEEVHHA